MGVLRKSGDCVERALPGAPLEPAAPERPGAPRGGRRPFALLLGLVAVPLALIDQASKLYVSGRLALYQSVPVIPNWFDITYTQNPGAAFSIFAGLPPLLRNAFLLTMSAGAIAVLLVLLARTSRITLSSFALALILGGAAGNLIDRAVRGRVVDFLRLHYYDLSYPVFNVADSAITVGVALVLLTSLVPRRLPPGRGQPE